MFIHGRFSPKVNAQGLIIFDELVRDAGIAASGNAVGWEFDYMLPKSTAEVMDPMFLIGVLIMFFVRYLTRVRRRMPTLASTVLDMCVARMRYIRVAFLILASFVFRCLDVFGLEVLFLQLTKPFFRAVFRNEALADYISTSATTIVFTILVASFLINMWYRIVHDAHVTRIIRAAHRLLYPIFAAYYARFSDTTEDLVDAYNEAVYVVALYYKMYPSLHQMIFQIWHRVLNSYGCVESGRNDPISAAFRAAKGLICMLRGACVGFRLFSAKTMELFLSGLITIMCDVQQFSHVYILFTQDDRIVAAITRAWDVCRSLDIISQLEAFTGRTYNDHIRGKLRRASATLDALLDGVMNSFKRFNADNETQHPGLGYEPRTFWQRHKRALCAFAAFAIVLVVLLIIYIYNRKASKVVNIREMPKATNATCDVKVDGNVEAGRPKQPSIIRTTQVPVKVTKVDFEAGESQASPIDTSSFIPVGLTCANTEKLLSFVSALSDLEYVVGALNIFDQPVGKEFLFQAYSNGFTIMAVPSMRAMVDTIGVQVRKTNQNRKMFRNKNTVWAVYEQPGKDGKPLKLVYVWSKDEEPFSFSAETDAEYKQALHSYIYDHMEMDDDIMELEESSYYDFHADEWQRWQDEIDQRQDDYGRVESNAHITCDLLAKTSEIYERMQNDIVTAMSLLCLTKAGEVANLVRENNRMLALVSSVLFDLDDDITIARADIIDMLERSVGSVEKSINVASVVKSMCRVYKGSECVTGVCLRVDGVQGVLFPKHLFRNDSQITTLKQAFERAATSSAAPADVDIYVPNPKGAFEVRDTIAASKIRIFDSDYAFAPTTCLPVCGATIGALGDNNIGALVSLDDNGRPIIAPTPLHDVQITDKLRVIRHTASTFNGACGSLLVTSENSLTVVGFHHFSHMASGFALRAEDFARMIAVATKVCEVGNVEKRTAPVKVVQKTHMKPLEIVEEDDSDDAVSCGDGFISVENKRAKKRASAKRKAEMRRNAVASGSIEAKSASGKTDQSATQCATTSVVAPKNA